MAGELTGDTAPSAAGDAVDVTDRAGRLVGIVSATALPLPAGAATAAGQVLANPLPVSAAALPLPAGAATAAGQVLANPLPVSIAAAIVAEPKPADLSVTVTGGANAIATATLPAVAGQFHYITHVSIRRVTTALLAGGAILAVTSTNLGGRSWRTGNQASITVDTMDGGLLVDADYSHPLKSAVVNTATTIVCPAAGAGVSWQIVVDYFAAA